MLTFSIDQALPWHLSYWILAASFLASFFGWVGIAYVGIWSMQSGRYPQRESQAISETRSQQQLVLFAASVTFMMLGIYSLALGLIAVIWYLITRTSDR